MQKKHFEVETDGFYGAYWKCKTDSDCAMIAMIGDDPEDYLEYLEEQQKKIEEHFTSAIDLARKSGIKLDDLIRLLSLLYEEG